MTTTTCASLFCDCASCRARRRAPGSHARDPVTSREAEAVVTATGTRATHCAAVLGVVRGTPGSTASEIERHVPYDLTETRRRLTDLKNLGLVRQGAPRVAAGRSKREVTWEPTEARA